MTLKKIPRQKQNIRSDFDWSPFSWQLPNSPKQETSFWYDLGTHDDFCPHGTTCSESVVFSSYTYDNICQESVVSSSVNVIFRRSFGLLMKWGILTGGFYCLNTIHLCKMNAPSSGQWRFILDLNTFLHN